jgi:hypothetical protein
MKLDELHYDVLYLIAKQLYRPEASKRSKCLNPRALNALVRTSRHFYQQMNPYLYHVAASDKYLAEDAVTKAAGNGQINVLKMFVAEGFSLDFVAHNWYGSGPLHAAAANGRVDVIKFLLDQKVDVNLQRVCIGNPCDPSTLMVELR